MQSSSEEDAKPPSQSQLTDNLSPGDISFKKCDNTEGSAASVASSLRASPVKLMSDSEDESAEFEHFLADRVKYLKENDSAIVSGSSHSRRNSELALQIIQENSMILRRMMQCQSRLSPSPPLYLKDDTESEMNPSEDKFDLENQDNGCSGIGEEDDFTESPQIHSRYHHILEKSKSLDERCNHLFHGEFLQQKKSALLEGLHESKSETPLAGASDIKSGELIQQNVNLLKALAAGKCKNQPPDRLQLSSRLIKENVDLLKSISSEKQCLSGSNENRVAGICEDSAAKLPINGEHSPLNENASVLALNSSIAGEFSSVDLLTDYALSKEEDKDSAISVNGGQSSEAATSHCLINFDDDFLLKEEHDYEGCDTPETSRFNLKKENFSASTPNFSASSALCEEQLNLTKSPSHVFNPFPVALNSRQSKEVPLKLGLYKK